MMKVMRFPYRWQQVGLVSEEADRARIQFKLSKATQNVTLTELAFVKYGNEANSAESNAKSRFILRSHVSYERFLWSSFAALRSLIGPNFSTVSLIEPSVICCACR